MPAVLVMAGANHVRPVNTIKDKHYEVAPRSCKTPMLCSQSCPKRESQQKSVRGQRHSLPAETLIFMSYMDLPTLLKYKRNSSTERMMK